MSDDDPLGGDCVFCGFPVQGNFSIHRDGFGVGPEVDLCDNCGGYEEPSCFEIWEKIAQPSKHSFAHRQIVDECEPTT